MDQKCNKSMFRILKIYQKNREGDKLINKIFKRFRIKNNCYNLNIFHHCACLILLYLTLESTAFSLQNQIGVHDPSSIVKDSNTYWIFGTGNGISSLYSTDLIQWNNGQTPFTQSIYPTWINTYVPAFAGNFWAPECIFMNGMYYLYYACSTWGVNTSCIGLATSPSLNKPVWTDQGVVVYSNSSKNYNTIDPSIFRDSTGQVWMTYGSWFSGIKMQALDSITGKPSDSTIYNVCTFSDPENSHVVRNGNYYYLFVNRGLCCQGVNSTYYIQVSRSTQPNGPYTGWRTVLSSSGNFIGPGSIGYYAENGTEWATFHYYDGNNSGNPTLAIGYFEWNEGWPIITQNWIENGFYKITNPGNNLIWSNLNCVNDSGTSVVQDNWINYKCQTWNLNQLGNGNYTITSGLGNVVASLPDCLDPGVNLILSPDSNTTCSTFRIEKNNIGNLIISVGENKLVVTSSLLDKPLTTNLYSGNRNQAWLLTKVSIDSTIVSVNNQGFYSNLFKITPNPVNNGNFTIMSSNQSLLTNSKLTLYDLRGFNVFNQTLNLQQNSTIYLNLKPGIYIIQIQNAKNIFTNKIIFN